VNGAEKEAYLREYEALKKKGKPFFPYAVTKDSVMALIVVAMIIVMALVLGAEQGPKVDPTTTTYVPRPEWYFFFLFELLRVIKPPELVPLATIIIPTMCMVLLLLLPFYDRNPERRPERRPVATTAGVLTIIAMAYLTLLGANAGSPTEIEVDVPQVRRERQRRPRPRADRDRREAATRGDRANAHEPVGGHAALHRPARGEVQQPRRLPGLAAGPKRLAAAWPPPRAPRARAKSSPLRCGRCSTASRASTT
jgi:hypothetical protein